MFSGALKGARGPETRTEERNLTSWTGTPPLSIFPQNEKHLEAAAEVVTPASRQPRGGSRGALLGDGALSERPGPARLRSHHTAIMSSVTSHFYLPFCPRCGSHQRLWSDTFLKRPHIPVSKCFPLESEQER